jgi:uncharacterized membrane protein
VLFRLKQLQGFSSGVSSGFVFVDEGAASLIKVSRTVNTSNAESLGIKTRDIVAAEIVTPATVQQYQQQPQTNSGGSRLQGAAAGAVLGFLLAGPLGTVVGGAAGSNAGRSRETAYDRDQMRKAQRQARIANDAVGLLAIDDTRGILVTLSDLTMPDFLKLQQLVAKAQAKKPRKKASVEIDLKALTKECPDCAEDVKLKAKVCRFCGHKWTEEEVDKSVKQALKGG